MRTLDEIVATVTEPDRILIKDSHGRGTSRVIGFLRTQYGFGPVMAKAVFDNIRQP